VYFPILITGDLHVTHRNLGLFQKFVEQVQSLEKQFNTFVIVGDVFESQDVTKWEAILEVFDFFKWLLESQKQIFLLSGTHDTIFLNRNKSTLQIFQTFCSVITSRVKINDFVWIPHSRDLEEDVQFLRDNLPARACFTHHMIKGLRIGYFVVPQGIPVESMQECDWVFNGHIHQPQVQGNIINVGSPWQHSFSEANQEKYLWICDGESVRPINSRVAPQYVIGGFEEIKDVDLKGKSVRILLKNDDNIDQIASFLEAAGASRWELRSANNQRTFTEVSPVESCHLDELVDRWANVKDLHPDEALLGKIFLGD
jgi:DNA repair exonuclease SbcCD nuclease subunit